MANARLKDIVNFTGIRKNMLIGYGLVVGLNGTGDGGNALTNSSIASMVEKLGVKVDRNNFNSNNIAAVIVTASLKPFARLGDDVDVNVSAIGGSKSLQGGTLLVTPLYGADGQVYVVAQGGLNTGGFAKGNAQSNVTKNNPTSARIASGGIVEKEIDFDLNKLKKLRLTLRNPDLTTAKRVTDVINMFMNARLASALDNTTIDVVIPEKYKGRIMEFMAAIEQLRVVPDQSAKIIIDLQNNTLIIGKDVKLSKVAVAHENITVHIQEEEAPIAQVPGILGLGDNAIGNLNFDVGRKKKTDVEIKRGDNKLTIVNSVASLEHLVNIINDLGVSMQDLTTILFAIKASGSLQAEIEVIS